MTPNALCTIWLDKSCIILLRGNSDFIMGSFKTGHVAKEPTLYCCLLFIASVWPRQKILVFYYYLVAITMLRKSKWN